VNYKIVERTRAQQKAAYERTHTHRFYVLLGAPHDELYAEPVRVSVTHDVDPTRAHEHEVVFVEVTE
jgi:hypothetical protein